jgi:hypothetical protein
MSVEIKIDTIGGNCPVQAEGTINGKPFYFRARGQHWSLSIGGADLIGNPEFSYAEKCGDGPFTAGWITEDEARTFIDRGAAIFANQGIIHRDEKTVA